MVNISIRIFPLDWVAKYQGYNTLKLCAIKLTNSTFCKSYDGSCKNFWGMLLCQVYWKYFTFCIEWFYWRTIVRREDDEVMQLIVTLLMPRRLMIYNTELINIKVWGLITIAVLGKSCNCVPQYCLATKNLIKYIIIWLCFLPTSNLVVTKVS